MAKKCYLIVAVLFGMATVLSLSPAVYGQRTVNVSPGFGTLNTAIDGDTTATGERVDTNTVYVLERGGVYILDGSIENRFPLTIVAEEGDGARPQLIPGVGSGGESSRAFRARSDLTIRGLYVTNEDELGGLNTRIVRISADDVRIIVDDCHLDKDGQSGFRFDNNNNRVFVTNSIISNIAGDWDNGRGFDDRGNIIDTLVVENTTFYNISSRVLRDGGGYINYLKFEHCTFANTGRRIVDAGEVVEFIYRNNMAVNHSILGSDDPDAQTSVNMDTLSSESLQGLTQTVDIRNNNFYRDPAFDAVYPDTVMAIPIFDSLATVFIEQLGTESTITNEAITFTNGPMPLPNQVTTFYESGEAKESLSEAPFDVSGEPFDFSYPEGAASFTGSTNGQPLGDLNWFGLAVSVDDPLDGTTPTTFHLLENFPNPFNPSTNIVYELPRSTRVKLTVYNVLGQKVRELVNGELLRAGRHTAQWNGRDDRGQTVSSGVYLYRLEAGDFVQTNKMLLLK